VESALKPVRWVGSSKRDLKAFPRPVQREVGQALYAAQCGEEYPSVKALRGFGGRTVLEIIAPYERDTFRATRCASATLFTCCTPFRRNRSRVSPRLRRKSNSSNNGSPRQNGTIERGTTEMKKNNIIRVKEGSGNVFADLGFPNPERERLKARLTLQIYRLIKDLGLTQAKAGAILGIRQPHVSGLMRGQSGNFSVERLMDFLTALGQDVEITVRPASKEHGGVSLVLG
jgi:predicted XRE-type DNA-binding protein